MVYTLEKEGNAATVTTDATGAGTVTATKLSQVSFAMLSSSAAGYVIVQTASPTGQDIPFQVYESAGTAGALAKPTAAVSFDPDTINILEVGR